MLKEKKMDKPRTAEKLADMFKGYASDEEEQIMKDEKNTRNEKNIKDEKEIPKIQKRMVDPSLQTTSKKQKIDALKLLLQNSVLIRETVVSALDEEIEDKKERIKELDSDFDMKELQTYNNKDSSKMNVYSKQYTNTIQLQKELEEKINKDYNMQNVIKTRNCFIASPRKNIRVVIYPNQNQQIKSLPKTEVYRNVPGETPAPIIIPKEKVKMRPEVETKYYNRLTNKVEQGITRGNQTEKRKHQISWLAKEALNKLDKVNEQWSSKKRRTTNDKYGW